MSADAVDAVELLREMVATRSLSGEEQVVARLIVERMSALGYAARVDEAGNAVGVIGSGSRTLVLLGHMDTVPGEIPVRIEGDTLHGRGSVDAKGPLATFIMAAAKAAIPDDARVVVIGAVEEEAATSKGARHVARTMPAPLACVIGEPSSAEAVTLGYKGRLLADVRLRIPGGHSAGPERSVGQEAFGVWSAIERHAAHFNEGRERLFDQLLISLRSINTSSDGLHDVAEMTMGFRLPPRFDVDALRAFVEAAAGGAASEIVFRGAEQAHEDRRDSTIARSLTAAIREVCGARPAVKLKTGTSDMNVVAPVWGCPVVAYGPGDSRLDHTPEERISIAEYRRAIDVLARGIELFFEMK